MEELLVQAESDRVDEQEYIALLNDLKMGRSLVYLTDNCGEIVMDKLFYTGDPEILSPNSGYGDCERKICDE